MNRITDMLSRKGNAAVSVSPDTSVSDALKLMAEKNIGSVVVMENNKLMTNFNNNNLSGIISITDVVKEAIILQQQTINHLYNYIHSG